MKQIKTTFIYTLLILLFCCITTTVAHTWGQNYPELLGKGSWASTEKIMEKNVSFETAHFILSYPEPLEESAKEIATILERLYSLYSNKYGIVLPKKTEVMVQNSPTSGGWALAIQNTMSIWVNELEFNLRGTPNWLENVVAHEYSHIVSIQTAFKFPAWMPYIQLGKFDHPNEKSQIGAMHIFPSEILPPWFFEGIAQYDSYRHDGDSWDSHRDMILRTLIISDSALTWDHMSVFNGRADDYEKTYDHGFSMVKYICETYGEDKIAAILKESARASRFVFDSSIKSVLGISGRELYANWKQHLLQEYTQKIDSLGTLTTGKQLNKDGFNNTWPRFTHNEERALFLSNGQSDRFGGVLHSYNFSDTLKDSLRIRVENPAVAGFGVFYDLDSNNTILFHSQKSKKSKLPHNQGGSRQYDLFTYPLAKDTTKPKYKKKNEQQLTIQKNYQGAVYSPSGEEIAAIYHDRDKHYLVIGKRDGSDFRQVYPTSEKEKMRTIFSLDWSSDGSKIAMSYMDRDNRKVGFYDLKKKEFFVVAPDSSDSRDPRFAPNSNEIYFASDREFGIFNIFRYNITKKKLEKITNIASGAFSPDISNNGEKLLYTAYTSNGYQVFMMDSLSKKAHFAMQKEQKKEQKTTIDLALREAPNYDVEYISGTRKNYSLRPRKAIFIPTLISEEVMTDNDNPNKGISNTKYGFVGGFMDPMYWLDKGSSILFFYLGEDVIGQIPSIYNDKSNWYNYATDYGVMMDTKLFPVDLSLFYFSRILPAQNEFIHNNYGEYNMDTLDYALQPMAVQLKGSYAFEGLPVWKFSSYKLGAFSSYMNYRVNAKIADDKDSETSSYFFYSPADVFRNGLLLTSQQKEFTQKYNISPYGTAFKLQYEYNYGRYVDQDRVLKIKDNKIIENYNKYHFHVAKADFILGKASWLFPGADVELKLGTTGLLVSDKTQKMLDDLSEEAMDKREFPSFFQPAIQVPGYSYYYRADSTRHIVQNEETDYTMDTIYVPEDSVVATGNAIIEAHQSYRFPLHQKKSLDKKIGVFYLDKLYGAINGGGVMTAQTFQSLQDKKLKDAFYYAGAEVRLQTIYFNTYPLSLSFRWDYGFKERKKFGGNHYKLSLGFAFDSWGIIEEPDGIKYQPAYLGKMF